LDLGRIVIRKQENPLGRETTNFFDKINPNCQHGSFLAVTSDHIFITAAERKWAPHLHLVLPGAWLP